MEYLRKILRIIPYNTVINIVTAVLLAVTAYVNYLSLDISNQRYLLENRPYAYIQDFSWGGKYENLFSVTIKNPANFPVYVEFYFVAKDENGKELLRKSSSTDENTVVIFPYEQTETAFIGYRKLELTQKSNPENRIVLGSKNALSLVDYYNSGKPLTLELLLDYTLLTKGARKDSYHYRQSYLIEKIDSQAQITKKTLEAD